MNGPTVSWWLLCGLAVLAASGDAAADDLVRLVGRGQATALAPGFSGWEVLARTAEGRPIEYTRFGQGQFFVLVVGPLEGDRPEGVEMANRLAEHLARFPRALSADVSVTIVRDPNPEGRNRRTVANSRGVEPNRNFFTTDWQRTPGEGVWLSGREPESEAETRALAELLRDLKPDRVVLLGAAASVSVTMTGPAYELAQRVAEAGLLRVLPADGQAIPGSLMTLGGTDLGIATLRLNAAAGADREANWEALKRPLLAAIEHGAGNKDAGGQSARVGGDAPAALAPSATLPVSQTGEMAASTTLPFELLLEGSAVVPVVSPRSMRDRADASGSVRAGAPASAAAAPTSKLAPVEKFNVQGRVERPVRMPQPPIPLHAD